MNKTLTILAKSAWKAIGTQSHRGLIRLGLLPFRPLGRLGKRSESRWVTVGQVVPNKPNQGAEIKLHFVLQSADVERSCKAHKIIHTKARNRLYTKTVQLLLFSYINLRLMNKCTAEMGDFLTQSLSACDDEQELAAGERETTDEPEEEAIDMTLED